jgi:drug/metabolite transporter (DMT)-like permease
MESRLWMLFVLLAGLCWGTYVPLIAQGGKELKSSYAALLCVGVAYFLIAILFPTYILWSRGKMPNFSAAGITLATLAGVAGALGALCVIFATFEYHGPRIYVAPVIFALAPVINTIVSLIWQPTAESAWRFGLPEHRPGWQFWAGIFMAAIGAALVLYSKEAGEPAHASKAPATPVATAPVASPQP